MVTPQSQSVRKVTQTDKSAVTNLLADGSFFKNVLCCKKILTKIVGYQQPTCLLGRNLWLEPFRFHVNGFHFREIVFVLVGPAQLCMENSVLVYMRSAVEVAWLAQNI